MLSELHTDLLSQETLHNLISSSKLLVINDIRSTSLFRKKCSFHLRRSKSGSFVFFC